MSGHRSKSIAGASQPGPGEYSPEASSRYMFPPLAKTISVVVPELYHGIPLDTPGPGAYNPNLRASVPSVPGVKCV
jgi:hypothetical protein